MSYVLDNWEDISIDAYDAWMMSLQSELDAYESCDDEEGAWQVDCEIRRLANLYAEQIKREYK